MQLDIMSISDNYLRAALYNETVAAKNNKNRKE
jgi:hypothetical protein